MNTIELLDFVKSLDRRGLLSKSIEELDYEWVIWDYERIKVKSICENLNNNNTNLFNKNINDTSLTNIAITQR